jgi:hypothetical protein
MRIKKAPLLLRGSGFLNIPYSGQLVIRFIDCGKQRPDPEYSLAICQAAGGRGTRTGCVSAAGIGVHCAGT